MVDMDETALREVLDRQAIMDCIYRYCRGVDRFDTDLIASVFHPDAHDDHGVAYQGLGPGIAENIREIQDEKQWSATQHHITNALIDLDGDTAHVETYLLVSLRRRDGSGVDCAGARNVDRFERRDGEWRIAARVWVWEWSGVISSPPEVASVSDGFVNGARDSSDVSYQRPLEVVLPASPR
jgi:ketosteroid isomerase-like protein